jgi:hypothetical protein
MRMPLPGPRLSLVVFRAPGPAESKLVAAAAQVRQLKSSHGPAFEEGYVVLESDDFDRLWNGLEAGDALGAAFEILPMVGPEGAALVDRLEEFTYGWIGEDKSPYGRVLLLEVLPQIISDGPGAHQEGDEGKGREWDGEHRTGPLVRDKPDPLGHHHQESDHDEG